MRILTFLKIWSTISNKWPRPPFQSSLIWFFSSAPVCSEYPIQTSGLMIWATFEILGHRNVNLNIPTQFTLPSFALTDTHSPKQKPDIKMIDLVQNMHHQLKRKRNIGPCQYYVYNCVSIYQYISWQIFKVIKEE